MRNIGRPLYQMTEKMLQMRPGYGLSKLREMEYKSLPGLNEQYHKRHWSDLRNDLF